MSFVIEKERERERRGRQREAKVNERDSIIV